MIDPGDPPERQVAKQSRIIEALLRRVERQHDVSTSAYTAFQSAIALQGQVWAKDRDLERASNELESLRFDRARTERSLTEAVSLMEGGFALFQDGRLQNWNRLFAGLLPDIAPRVLPGLPLDAYLAAAAGSAHLVGAEARARLGAADEAGDGPHTFVAELRGDRWFQFTRQRTSPSSVILLQTEITGIVRANRLEKDALIGLQARHLQAAFDAMSIGMGIFSREGTLMLRNDRFRDLLGLPLRLTRTGTSFAEILDLIRDRELIAPVDLDGIEGWWPRLLRRARLRHRLRHRGGWVLDLNVHLLPDRGFLVDLSDVTLEDRGTRMLEEQVADRTRDLTEANARLVAQSEVQSRVEDELRRAMARAEAAVSSKTRFLAAASHDLLQPINAAKLLISTLDDMAGAGAAAGDIGAMVGRLEDTFGSVETLLHALLDISRLDSTESLLVPSGVALGPLIESVTEDQAPLARRRGVTLRVVPTALRVRSDPRYLLRSIQNLVVNAIQYSEGGRVLVGCRRRGTETVLQVWDTGIGISEADQAHVFEEFRRGGGGPAGGMGLGLSIVERTCRHLGHGLTLCSRPGVGSVFAIAMELDRTEGAEPRPPPPTVDTEDGRLGALVLIVENEPDVRFAMTRKLESWGASVFPTGSTAEALAVLRDAATAPDIVLADHRLDGEDTGWEAIRAIRAATGVAVPAIMVTADRSPALAEAGTREGFALLAKPVDLPRLRRSIARLTRPGPVETKVGDDSRTALADGLVREDGT